MKFPDEINKYLKNKTYTLNQVGLSESKVYVFDQYVLKVNQRSRESENEYQVLKFLQGKIEVPSLIDFVSENGLDYLLMGKLDGYMSFDEKIANDPEQLVYLLATAILKLWSIDYQNLDNPLTLDEKLQMAEISVKTNQVRYDLIDKSLIKSFESPDQILTYLKESKPAEDLVLTHGDYCLPNVFFLDNCLTGFVDLGRAGISDRYQDIALCLRSLKYNLKEKYKESYQDLFFSILGVEYDEKKLFYYLLLDELF